MQAAIPYGERPSKRAAAYTIGPSSLAHVWAEQFTTWQLDEGPVLPKLQGVLSRKSECTISDSADPITKPMCWLLRSSRIAQTRTYIIYISFASLLFFTAHHRLSVFPPRHALHHLLLYSWLSTSKTRNRNKQACFHCSLINTTHFKRQARSART